MIQNYIIPWLVNLLELFRGPVTIPEVLAWIILAMIIFVLAQIGKAIRG